MDWFTHLEERRKAILFAFFLLLIATLAVTCMRDNQSYDVFWHLRMGQDWVEHGLSPWQDHYSFTYPGAEIQSPPVLFDVAIYQATKWFGLESGLKLFLFACTLLILFAAAAWLRHVKAPVLIYCLVLPTLVALLQMRATVRPELVSYAFSILALYLYVRAESGLTMRNMLPIAVLMLLWTNYHSSIFGYVLFFGLFLDMGIRQIAEKSPPSQWFKWLAWGGVIVGAGFLNPSFAHPLISMLAFPEEWKSLIQEYQSPLVYANVPSVYALALMAILTFVLLLRQHRFGLLIVAAVLCFYALSMARIVVPAGIVMLCIFALVMSATDLKSALLARRRRQQRVLGTLALLVFLVPLLNDVITARVFIRQNFTTMWGYFPKQMVDYMQASGKRGRILNEYELGGYLLDRLAPDSSVYIDGRTEILYPVQHYTHFKTVMQNAASLKSELEKYDIDYAVLKNTAEQARIVYQAGLMQLDYADVRYFLYSRDNAQYPIAGLLWGQPYCWKPDFTKKVADERLKAVMNLSPASPLTPFLDFIWSYTQAANGAEFLAQVDPTHLWVDSSKRFAGYQALKHGMYDLAKQSFSNVTDKEPKDYLAQALAALKGGHPAEAENTLDRAMHMRWGSLEFSDIVLLEAVLREIQHASPLTVFEPGYVDGLTSQVGHYSLSASGKSLGADSFCFKIE